MADVLVDGGVVVNYLKSARTQVWPTQDIGYQFYIDGSDDLRYRKTTDGGATWATGVVVRTGTVQSFDIWYDKDTPGNTGTIIHIWFVEGAGSLVRYRTLDTASDTLGTDTIVVDLVSSTGSVALVSGTVAADGNRVVIYDIDGGAEAGGRDSPDGVTWSAIASPIEGVQDYFLLFPGNEADPRDLWLVFWDKSADEITLKTYDDSLDSWSEATIGAATDTTHVNVGSGFSGSIRLSDGHLILAYANGRDTAGPVDDLLVWDINGAGSITALTNVITNQDDWYNPSVFIDHNNDDIYIAYNGKADGSETIGTTTNIYYVKSTDGGATWGAETLYSTTGAAYLTCTAALGGTASRFIPSFWQNTAFDLFVNVDNSVAIGTSVINITPSPVAIPIVIPAPMVAINRTITPSVVAIPIAIPAPIITLALQTLTPSPVAIPIVIPAPSILVITVQAYQSLTRLLNPNDWGGSPTLILEIHGFTSSAGSPINAHLYNITDSAVVSGSQISSANTVLDRLRSSTFSLAAGSKEYEVRYGGASGATYTMEDAVLIVSP